MIQLQVRLMLCSKCKQLNGQMVCHQCYEGMETLRQQKIDAYSSKREQYEKQLATYQSQSNIYGQKLNDLNRKIILAAKIKQLSQKNQLRKLNIAKKTQQIVFLQESIDERKKILTLIARQRKEAKMKIIQSLKTLSSKQQTKKQLTKSIISRLQQKFIVLTKYLSMDSIEPCKSSDWKQFFNEESQHIATQQSEQILSEEVLSAEQTKKERKQLIASHFARSITAINLLAHIHDVKLPYKTGRNSFKITTPLINIIYDKTKNQFNLSFLKFHQANTIYLYSRVCITVHHPEVQQGRFEELHEAFIKRLKGYANNPISQEVSKPISMMELTSESLTSIGQAEAHEREQEKSRPIYTEQQDQQQLLMREVTELIGFQSINSDDDIELLA